MQTIIENTPTQWIENLALEELRMDESGIVNFNDHLNPSFFLEESSIALMDSIKQQMELYVNRFNEYRGAQGSQIKLFKISNTVNDFMLFRNSLRLIFARKNINLISVGFLSATGQIFGPRINEQSAVTDAPHEIKARVGAYNKIIWEFMGEEVDVQALVRHYMTEFIRSSAK
jgi:hypothetical protein